MSYHFEGRYYHDYNEYQRAKAARSEIQLLQAQAAESAERSRRFEGELAKVHGDLRRTAELNRHLQRSQDELKTIQERMARAQEQFERDTAAEFECIRKQAEETREDLSALEAEHRRQAVEVNQLFAETRQQVAAGLAEAEARRAAGEARLRSEVAEVDRKFEADQEARRAQRRTDADRAAGLIDFLRERVKVLAARQEELAFRDKVHGVVASIEYAAQALERGDVAIAVSVIHQAAADLKGAEAEAVERTAEMAADRLWATETSDQIATMLENQTVQDYYPVEAPEAAAQIQRIKDRLPLTHDTWDRKHAREYAAADLRNLDVEVRQMVATAPAIHDQETARLERMREVMARLEETFGEFGQVRDLDARRRAEILPGDPKQVTILRLHFQGKETVDLHFPLDPAEPVQIEGAGHSNRTSCQDSAVAISQILAGVMGLTAPEVDAQPRQAPTLQPRQTQATWSGLVDRLAELRKNSEHRGEKS